jgi:hypothetical protein
MAQQKGTRMRRRDAILICIILLLAYSYALPRWADWSQNSRLDLVRALVEQGTTRIDAYVANTGDYAEYHGHTYTDKPPGLSLVGVPVYAVALPLIDRPAVAARLQKLAGGGALRDTLNPQGSGINRDKLRHFVAQVLLTGVTVAIPAAALGALLYLTLGVLGFGRGPSLLVTLGYGLATPALAYGGNYYSHQFVAALLFGAFALLLRAGHKPPTTGRTALHPLPAVHLRSPIGTARALLLGLLCGFAVISEYPAALIVAAIGLWALARLTWRDLAIAAAGGALPLLLMAVYDLQAFGTIWPVGYAHSALWQGQHHTGFMSITYPRAEALWGLLFSPFRGLFVRAPWLLLAVPGFVLWFRSGARRGAFWAVLAAVAGLTLFYGSSIMWWGGFGVGPRYLVPMLPFLALAAAFGVRVLWGRPAGRLIACGLVAASGLLVWAETLAGQSFPFDTLHNPWLEYTLPAWLAGDIARNLGMALGLRGPLSLLPLVLTLAALIALLVWPPRARRAADRRAARAHEAIA